VTSGDLFWVEFPPGAGRAQSGRRPAIVVQASASSAKLPTILLVPLTTQLDALRFPGTVIVDPATQNGLRVTSVALVFQMTAIDKRSLGRQLGAMTTAVMDHIWRSFDELTGRS
jgi:mRNA-degrading endonuclease toxin of MazEF toxin-antitoxin module